MNINHQQDMNNHDTTKAKMNDTNNTSSRKLPKQKSDLLSATIIPNKRQKGVKNNQQHIFSS